MIKISVGLLNNDLFWGAMECLENEESTPIAVAFHINKIKDALQKEVSTASKIYNKILSEFAELDDKGNIKAEVIEDQGLKKPRPVLKEDIDQKEYHEKMKELFDTEVTIDLVKIKLSDLKGCKLSARMTLLLQPLID